MRKTLFILFNLIFIAIHSTEVYSYEDDYIKIENISENFNVIKRPFNVMEMNGRYYLHLQYSFRLNDELTNATIIFKVKNGIEPGFLLKSINKDIVRIDPGVYGMGDIYSIANSDGFTIIRKGIERYATDWGSSISNDIAIYKVNYNTDFVDEVLVQLINVWPNNIKMPYIVDNKDIDIYINEQNEISFKYVFYDSLISEYITFKNFLNNDLK